MKAGAINAESVVFDRAADFYDQTRGFAPAELPAIVALFLSTGALTPSTRALELGIGTGRIALPLAPHVRHYAGVDLSRPMLRRLRAKQTGEPIAVVEGDATRLPFASASVDAVIAVHVFHLVAAWQTALREVARVLRRGGVLIAGSAEHPAGGRDDQDLRRVWHDVAGAGEEVRNVGVPREQYDTFLSDAGWQRVGERRVHSYLTTHTVRELLARIEGRVWSSMWRVSDEAHTRGLAAVRALIAEQQMDLDAPVTQPGGFGLEVYTPPLR